MSQSVRVASFVAPTHWLVGGLLLALFVRVIAVSPAQAATRLVTNTNDSGPGSLRQTIAAAAPGDTITFAPEVSGTIILTSGELSLNKDVTITGPGAKQLIISGNNASRVISVTVGIAVTLTDLAVADGRTGGNGAGIYNAGALTLISDLIYNNNGAVTDYYPQGGWGIHNAGGTLILTNSEVYNNTEGGIYNRGGVATLNHSAVYSNVISSGGGTFNIAGIGIINETTSLLTLNTSHIYQHWATWGIGVINRGTLMAVDSLIYANNLYGLQNNGQATLTASAIYKNNVGLMHYGDTLTITDGSIYANDVGLMLSGGRVVITNTTVSGHRYSFLNNGTALTLNNVTVVNNEYGIQSSTVENPQAIKISNSILANTFSNCYSSLYGTSLFASGGHNLESRNECGFNGLGDLANTDPLLAPLANNGGLSTHRLLFGSPVLNAGHPDTPGSSENTCATTDQRGIPRPQMGRCDIGAVEALDAPDVVAAQTVSPVEAHPGETVIYTLIFTNVGFTSATSVVLTESLPSVVENVNVTSSGAALTPLGSYAWQVADLAPGAGGIMTFTGRVVSTLVADMTSTAVATITSPAEVLAERNNNTGSASLSVKLPRVSLVTDDWYYKLMGNAVVTVTLDVPAATTITINYAASDGTALAGTDYLATAGVLTFTPGAIAQPFPVGLLNNPANTTGRIFTVTLNNPARAILLNTSASVLIVPGNTLVVTNQADTGSGSLRQAVADAVTGDTITFAPHISGAIELTMDELVIDKSLFLIGPGADKLTLSGSSFYNWHRVLSVSAESKVTLSGLALAYGFTDENGAGIYNRGTLTLIDCSIHDNWDGLSYYAGSGGGLYNDRGRATLINTQVHHNQAELGAGAHNVGGTLTLVNSRIYSNVGSGLTNSSGYDFYSYRSLPGLMSLDRVVVYGNTGNGVVNDAMDGMLQVVNSNLYNNAGRGLIAGYSPNVTISNTSISGNEVGIEAGRAALNNVTIFNNGGGLMQNYDSVITLTNSILANNQSADCIIPQTIPGFTPGWKTVSLGYNLISDNSCGLNATGDLTNTNPLLGPLADNGGAVPTHGLLAGSPALNAGNPNAPGSGAGTCATTDARGVARPQAGRCDIGAFEAVAGADVMVRLTAQQTKAHPGEPYTYTLAFNNLGLTTATGVILTNVVPSFLTNVNVTNSGAAFTPLGGPRYVWQVADLPLGAGGVITVSGVVNPALTLGAMFTNTATLATSTPEFDVNNNTSSASITISPPQAHLPGFYIAPKDSGVFTVSAQLDVASALTITVDYATQDGTAQAGTDYLTATGTLTFAPGVTAQAIPLIILNDPANTSGRSFGLKLSHPVNADADTRSAIVLVVPQVFRFQLPLIMR